MSYKTLLLGISSVSIVGTSTYAIYTSSKTDNKKIEKIPDVVNFDYLDVA